MGMVYTEVSVRVIERHDSTGAPFYYALEAAVRNAAIQTCIDFKLSPRSVTLIEDPRTTDSDPNRIEIDTRDGR